MALTTSVVIVHDTPSCRLVTDDTYSLPFDRLVAAASPFNWPQCLPGFFTAIHPNGSTADGWTRIIEHVRYGLIRLRTPLRFHLSTTPGSYRLNYELDTAPAPPHWVDDRVRVDEGYIAVTRAGSGVRIRTEKILAMRGLSAYLASWSAPWLGWNVRGHEFFTNQARITDPIPFPAAGWSPPRAMDGVIRNEY